MASSNHSRETLLHVSRGKIGVKRAGRSVSRFEDDEDTRWFGFVRPETCERRIAPIRKIHNFASRSFRLRHAGGLQDIETAIVEKERMVPEHSTQLLKCRMIVWKHFGFKLAQGLFQLC